MQPARNERRLEMSSNSPKTSIAFELVARQSEDYCAVNQFILTFAR